MTRTLAALYGVLREVGEAGYRVHVGRDRVEVVGAAPLAGPLLERLRAVKPTLLAMASDWRPGDDVLTWPDRVYQAYAHALTAGAPGSLARTDNPVYERFRSHNVVRWEQAIVRTS